MATTACVGQFISDVTLNPTSIPAFSRQIETFAVPGLTIDMVVAVKAPSLEAGVFLIGGSCTAKDVLSLTLENVTSAAIDPASQTFKVLAH